MTDTARLSARAAWCLAGLFLLLACVFYFSLLPLLSKKRSFRARVNELKEQITAEQDLHRKLQRERQLLEENDPTYLEKYARDNFGWARQGEIVYKLEKSK